MPPSPSQAGAQTLGITGHLSLAEADVDAMEPDDHSLMLAVRDGDTGRLGVLFERHHRPLYGFFLRMTGRKACSEDLVQQVFLRMLKYRHTYRDEGSFRSWMYQLARSLMADHFQKTARAPSTLEQPEWIEQLPDERHSAAHAAEGRDNLALMEKALSQLSNNERELLLLHRFQQLSHEELARLQRCSVGAVKVRVHRALQSLRECFFRLARDPS